MRVVQDHPAQAPVVGIAVPLDPLVVDVEVRRLRLAEESGDLRAPAAALLSELPAYPAAGEQVIRPRQG